MEKLCDEDNFTDTLCTAPGTEQAALVERWTTDPLAVDRPACRKVGTAHCRTVVEEHAEALLRATLDGKGAATCAKLLPKCDASRSADIKQLQPAPAANALPESYEAKLPPGLKVSSKYEV